MFILQEEVIVGTFFTKALCIFGPVSVVFGFLTVDGQRQIMHRALHKWTFSLSS